VDENYVDVKFDEEPIIGNERLHMMNQKEHNGMLLFCERSPLMSRIQVEYNMFATIEICKKVEDKKEKEEGEKEALNAEHKEDISNIYLECA